MKSLSSNHLGKKHLIESCQKIEVKPFVKAYKQKLKKMIMSSEIEIEGTKIRLVTVNTGNGGYRYFFSCPACTRRVGVLLKQGITGTIGCRTCLNLEYRKRRYKGMIENQ